MSLFATPLGFWNRVFGVGSRSSKLSGRWGAELLRYCGCPRSGRAGPRWVLGPMSAQPRVLDKLRVARILQMGLPGLCLLFGQVILRPRLSGLCVPHVAYFGGHPGVYGRGCQLREWNTEPHGSGRAVLTCAEAAGFPRCAARDVLQPVLPGTGSPRLSVPLPAWGFLGRNHATALLTAGRLFGAARVALNGRFSFPCEICRPAVKGGSLFIFFVKAL